MKAFWGLMAFMLVIAGCDEEISTPEPVREITLVQSPRAMLANVDSLYTMSVRVSEGFEPDSIACLITRAGDRAGDPAGVWVRLYDDGGLSPVPDPGFASSPSGDLVANSGTYTRRISGQLLAAARGIGLFRFSYRAFVAGSIIDSVGHESDLQNAGPCLIASLSVPADIAECGSGQFIEVQLSRWPSDHVDSVVAILMDSNNVALGSRHLSPWQSDSIWRAVIDPRLFECVGLDDSVRFDVMAWTRFGLNCSQSSGRVRYRNQRPSLSNSTLPDTVYRPVSGADTIETTVNLSDCELRGDSLYYGVFFSVRWWDVEEWTEDQSFFLRDDGVRPDAVAGDGMFTVGLQITPSQTRRDDVLHFRFFAIDCAAPRDSSEFLYDSTRVIQRIGTITAPPDDNGLGIRVIR